MYVIQTYFFNESLLRVFSEDCSETVPNCHFITKFETSCCIQDSLCSQVFDVHVLVDFVGSQAGTITRQMELCTRITLSGPTWSLWQPNVPSAIQRGSTFSWHSMPYLQSLLWQRVVQWSSRQVCDHWRLKLCDQHLRFNLCDHHLRFKLYWSWF